MAVLDADKPLRLSERSGRWVLAATVLGSGIAMLDATIVNVALRRIGADLHADLGGLQWTLSGYTLTLASLILLSGSLADRFGRRRLFVIGTAWFAAASVLCGLAPSIGFLIAARALQGVGGALLTPGSLAIISASFAPEDRSRAIGAWSGLGGIAGAVGPFLGGWLIEVWSWRLVFLVNLPLAAAVIAVALRHVPESWDPTADHRLDVTGALLGALGLAGVTYAFIAAGQHGASAGTLVAGLAGAAVLVGFVLGERRSDHPMVPPGLFRSRQFTATNLATFAIYAAFGSVFFLLVLNLQVVAGYSPIAAGAAGLPITGLMLALSARSGALAQRIGPRLQLTAGPLIGACGLLLMLRIHAGSSYVADVLPGVIVFGLGLSTLVAPLTSAVLGSAPGEHAGVASGVNNAVARTAGLLAVALIPTLAGLSGADYQAPGPLHDGFRVAMLINVGLLVAGAALSAFLIRNEAATRAATAPLAGPVQASPTGATPTGATPTGATPTGAAAPAPAGTGPTGTRETGLAHCFSCPVDGPRLETVQPTPTGRT
jgi:EmrB/QacA subfamily drug resistance transporter